MINISYEKYKKFLPVVIATVFSLIFVGSVVRTTGSGMGCPDWPKCFGQFIPPTHIDQLPADYKSLYKVAGREIADFSAFKTWIEYTNRLFGVWTGIATLILAFLGLKIRKSHSLINKLSISALLLVIFNGWLGSKVVSTHLMPGIITAHMILAMLLVFCLLKIKYLVVNIEPVIVDNIKKYKNVSLILLVMVFVQIILGTQVREQIDHITNHNHDLPRANWVENLDMVFYVHRSFSIAIVLGLFYFLKNIIKEVKGSVELKKIATKLVLVMFGEVAAGAILVYFKFPAPMQSLHLIFSILMIAYLFEITMILFKSKSREVAL
ncbi:heme A synthase [Bacteriovorax sp. Seq25_V]|uniref:COX15/CtaA family protein n=1 Tax=Bacteriovorax sp. Seq25_V TaxID=1201288 RepID=UPI000389E211|nr:COX15/CtaA family protein [Bacteriovorax sp. Seq25_V]EQC43460.1 cytochrome oxidase assembly protein [Bacteriovorax sp. Seq25_V]